MEKQCLYILSNPRHDGLYKVGGTSKNPAIRANQLSRQTGVIGKFRVEWSIVVPDWVVTEKMARYLLREQAEEKEYFKLNLLQTTEILTAKLTQFFELGTVEVYGSERVQKLIKAKEKAEEARKRIDTLLEKAINITEEQELEELKKKSGKTERATAKTK